MVAKWQKGESMKVGIVGCSDGIYRKYDELEKALREKFESIGVQPLFSPYIKAEKGVFSGSDREKAEVLMEFYKDSEISEIFDISGGDLANGILPYLDFEIIEKSEKRFWGYSDLTTVLNAIFTKTGKKSMLYQIKNIVYDKTGTQMKEFSDFLSGEKMTLFQPKIKFLRGKSLEGKLVGGNLRCFLKLAGTEFFPNVEKRVLVLEAYGGEEARLATALTQLSQMGVFSKVSGVLFGTFTEFLAENTRESLNAFLLNYLPENLPVAFTEEVGHGVLSRGLVIGEEIVLRR